MEREYTKDEQRVADYLSEITNNTVGGGDDPIGFLIASHRVLARRQSKADNEIIQKAIVEIDGWAAMANDPAHKFVYKSVTAILHGLKK